MRSARLSHMIFLFDTGTALARGRLIIISVVSCISCVIEPDNWNKAGA
jgi:hypothetical protein